MKSILLTLTLTFVLTIKLLAEKGLASVVADKFQGSQTASGVRYDKHKLTAAHRTLPFGTHVSVTNVKTGKKVSVLINDRGPFAKGHIIDLSAAASAVLGVSAGAPVELTLLEKTAPLGEPEPVEQPKPKPTSTEKSLPAYDLYKVQVLPIEHKGFGVQIGSYSEYDNVIRRVAILQEKWHKNVLISIENNGKDKPVYKVVLGVFNEKPEADAYLEELLKKEPKSKNKKTPNYFIVDFSTVKYE